LFLQLSDEARPRGFKPKNCHSDEPSLTQNATEGAVLSDITPQALNANILSRPI
jgi:hypothetical protein